MKVIDCAQRSVEWHAARCGLFTASNASDMLAMKKKGGDEGYQRRDLRVRLVCERLTGQSQENGYVNAEMQRGIDKEPDALLAYEALTGELARPVGFVAHDTLKAGCSPDGIIGDFVGGLELKCPKTATHLSYIRGGVLPADYLPQIVHSLWITGCQWWDFVSFDDRLPPALQVFRVRFEREQVQIDSYEAMARAFLNEIDREVEELMKLTGAVA